MAFVLVGLFLFLILMLIAFRIGFNKEKTENEEPAPVLHQSGIYSIMKRSPREDLLAVRPSRDELRKYLATKNEDSFNAPVGEADRERLVHEFFNKAEVNIKEIEAGDDEGCEFYYYDFATSDPVCAPFVRRGQYVTRADVFKHPELIPPFHPGCTCRLLRQHPDENLSETVTINMDPFLEDEKSVPALADWKCILNS